MKTGVIFSVLSCLLHGGELTRIANTTLDLPASAPTEGAYTFENAFGALTFTGPVNLATAPGDNRYIYVVEKRGQLHRVDLTNNTKTLFMDLATWVNAPANRSISSSGENGFLACTFHPDYQNNGRIFIFYSLFLDDGDLSTENRHQRVAEVTAIGTPGNYQNATSVDFSTHKSIITQYDEASNHNGGDLHFGSDGYLYISVGDEGGGGDNYNNGDRIDRDFFAAILRIDIDKNSGTAPNPHSQLGFLDSAIGTDTYTIPPDNPYVTNNDITYLGRTFGPDEVRSEIWVSSLRNPFRFSFDPPTGRCFIADVGQNRYEEINLVTGGEDCGWSREEGLRTFPGNSVISPAPSEVIHAYGHGSGTTQGRSVTGGLVYRGARLSELAGNYIFSDYVSGNVWALSESGGIWTSTRIEGESGIAAFGEDPRNGDLLVCDNNSNRVRRLVRETSSIAAPQLLSDTGAFSNLANLTPKTGIYPYDINQPFWSDYAIKKRWFAIPSTSTTMTYSETERWNFPAGQVWIKHFDLETVRGDSSTARKLETRFLVKTADSSYGLTYRWRTDQSDAELVAAAGLEEPLTITVDGSPITQTWSYPSRTSCIECHRDSENSALSFNTRQLNRDGQLEDLACSGFLDTTPSPAASLLKHPSIRDNSVSLEARVRSYLQVNCAMCHFGPDSPNPGSLDCRINTQTDLAGLINAPASDNLGDTDNRILVPGDTAHSILLSRMAGTAGRMPPVGSNVTDPDALALITAWINGDLTTRQSYDQWAASNSVGIGSQDDDQDGDSNLMEYLSGTNPNDGSDRFSLSITEDSVTVPAPANRSTLVEGSFDLQSWFLLPSPLNTSTPPTNPGMRTIPIPGDPAKIFIRAALSQP